VKLLSGLVQRHLFFSVVVVVVAAAAAAAVVAVYVCFCVCTCFVSRQDRLGTRVLSFMFRIFMNQLSHPISDWF
jgi:hypothetical protein